MNIDHVHSLIAYCKHYHGLDVSNPKMIGIDNEGFDVRVQIMPIGAEKNVRFNFEQPIHDAQSARMALVAMSKAVNS